MEDLLKKIVDTKLVEIEQQKADEPEATLYAKVEQMLCLNQVNYSLRHTLEQSSTGIIAEFKRKSPSLGWIKQDGLASEIPVAYQKAGASALSILTDSEYFGGSIDYLRQARALTTIPILRKDFILSEYQIFQAKQAGADVILLIAACLDRKICKKLAQLARSLNLEVLLEIHSENELDYITDDISIVGVNNRNLHLFRTDIGTSLQLSEQIPSEFLKISESGLKTAQDIHLLRSAGYRGFLMGERFMKSSNPGEALASLIKELAS